MGGRDSQPPDKPGDFEALAGGPGDPLARLLRDMRDDERTPAEPGGGAAPPLQPEGAGDEVSDAISAFGDERSVPPVRRRQPDDDIIEAGTLVSHYEVIRALGRGGHSQVYLARDTRLGRMVALKFLLLTSSDRLDRFIAEARVTAQFTHENVVTLYEVGTFRDQPYMVLEYVEGQSLREWINERKRARAGPAGGARRTDRSATASPRRAVALMQPVVQALIHLHDAGIVHRDLKPANIMLTDSGAVKVVDFGIAKLLDRATGRADQPDEGVGRADPRLTQTGDLIGTLMYMSPEQWGTAAVDARTDLWAVGLILYELLCGQHLLHPLSKDKLRAVGDLAVPMPQVSRLRPDLGALGPLIDRCLLKDKAGRIGSARELGAALERAVRPRWPRWVAGAAALAALAGVIGLMVTTRSAAPIGICDTAAAGPWRTREMPQPLAIHVDGLQAGWSDLRDRTCALDRRELSDPAFERRTRCLSAYRVQVRALIAGRGGAPRGAVLRNDAALYRLPEPAVCRAGSLSSVALPQPEDPALHDEIALLRARLSAGYDRLARGEPDGVVATAGAVLARAIELGWEPLQAEAHYQIGFVGVFAFQQGAAQRELEAAIALAEKTDHREILARARLLNMRHHALTNPTDSERFRQSAGAARAAITRYGWDDGLRAWMMTFDSTSKLLAEPSKLDQLQAARTLFRRVHMPLHAATVSVPLAVGLDARGERARAANVGSQALDTMLKAPAIPYELTCSLRLWDRLDAVIDRRQDTRALVRRSPTACPALVRANLLPETPAAAPKRHITGRVVDGAGRGVAGAQVILGSAIIGDGERALSPQLLPIGQSKVEISDGQGRFSFTHAHPRSLLLVAEADRGRSFPIVVKRAGERSDVTLALRRWGRAQALIAGGQRYEERMLVVSLFPEGAHPSGRSRLAVARPGSNQPFVFQRVAAGRYTATLAQLRATKAIHLESTVLAMVRDVIIEADTQRELSFAPAAAGSVALNTIIRNRFYGDLTMGVLFTIPGAHEPRSTAEMHSLWFESGAGARLANPHPAGGDGPAPPEQADKGDLFYRFTEVSPGKHTICAVPLSERDGEFAPMLYPTEGFPPELKVYCELVDIRDDAAEHTVIIEVEPVRR